MTPFNPLAATAAPPPAPDAIAPAAPAPGAPAPGAPVVADAALRTPGGTAVVTPGGSVVVVMPRRRSEPVTRLVNVVLALVLLVATAPLFAIVALLVKLTSPGPVIYSQTRVGLDRRHRGDGPPRDRRGRDVGGQPFTIYKFRSMRTDAEADGRAVWATRGDARVTPVGRVLRALRLDELPQLYNVLRGDMNLVGPRPERPDLVVELRTHIAEYQARHRVKPGLTGWAQIHHAYDATIDDVRQKVRYDLEYVQGQSTWQDLRILARTIPVVLFRKGGW